MATRKHPDYWHKAKRHLSQKDATLAHIIRAYKGETLASRGSAFFSLARAIVGQQISVKAADTVWKKLEATLGGIILPAPVITTEDRRLRACGLSERKVIYLKELAQFFTNRKRHGWHRQDDEEVITDLISIKGIGRWSAEMFLMFHLMRPDVFPLADLGLQKAIEKHYNAGRKMSPVRMRKLSEMWKPYRSVATWYLWRSLDPIPIEY